MLNRRHDIDVPAQLTSALSVIERFPPPYDICDSEADDAYVCVLHICVDSAVVGMLLSVGGLEFPRSCCSHNSRRLLEARSASSFGDGGASISLLTAVDNGLQAVWSASGAEMFMSGKGVAECTGSPGACLPPLAVSMAADQFVLLADHVIGDPLRQKFLRNVLHYLVRAAESGSTAEVDPASSSVLMPTWWGTQGDMLVQLQCALMMFEGWIASPLTTRSKQGCESREPELQSWFGLTAFSSEIWRPSSDNWRMWPY